MMLLILVVVAIVAEQFISHSFNIYLRIDEDKGICGIGK